MSLYVYVCVCELFFLCGLYNISWYKVITALFPVGRGWTVHMCSQSLHVTGRVASFNPVRLNPGEIALSIH
jgi:hypothetical protein